MKFLNNYSSTNVYLVRRLTAKITLVKKVQSRRRFFIRTVFIQRANRFSAIKLTPDQRTALSKVGELWHRRMGHISAPYVNRLLAVVEGVADLLCSHTQRNCEPCVLPKMTRQPCNQDRTPATRIGESVIHDFLEIVKRRIIFAYVSGNSKSDHDLPL